MSDAPNLGLKSPKADVCWEPSRHQLFGYPDELQDHQLQRECEEFARFDGEEVGSSGAAGDWRLVLQLDSDARLGMTFGDGGRLFVFLREADARRGEFGRAVTVWQPD
ncbi:MAG TPA: DUF1963 domain-containing protein [Phenylobacterium sp.]|nr:DUF1963 domain-containing protein [Phenylobacterium sp.]